MLTFIKVKSSDFGKWLVLMMISRVCLDCFLAQTLVVKVTWLTGADFCIFFWEPNIKVYYSKNSRVLDEMVVNWPWYSKCSYYADYELDRDNVLVSKFYASFKYISAISDKRYLSGYE